MKNIVKIKDLIENPNLIKDKFSKKRTEEEKEDAYYQEFSKELDENPITSGGAIKRS